jgi:hypothetical protein
MANPYWGGSLSRRWQIASFGPCRAFFGFGVAYKSESDALSVTRWDFASQFGLRWSAPRGRSTVELAMRHWSNAGIQLPNHGQDFVTLTFQLSTKP